MRVGIVGAGAIARRGHLPAWKAMRGVTVTAIADIDIGLARHVATEFGISDAVSDYHVLLDDSSIDIVDICVPTPNHHEVARAAMEANKHVLLEKPLTLTLKDALDLYDLASRVNGKFCPVQNLRVYESVVRARDILSAGRLGRVVSLYGRALNHLPVGWTRSTWLYHHGGVLYDVTPHLIDLVLWLLDDRVQDVFAVGNCFTEHAPFLSTAHLIIRFRGGTVAVVDTSWEIARVASDLEIQGTAGYLTLSMMRDEVSEGRASKTPLAETREYLTHMLHMARGAISGSLFNGPMLAYRPILQEFVRSITTASPPPVTLREGVRTIMVLEAAKCSIESGQPVSIGEMLCSSGVTPATLEDLP